jgi:ferredoxin-NADP reductase
MKQTFLSESLAYIEPIINLFNSDYWAGYKKAILVGKIYEGNDIHTYVFSVNSRKHWRFTPGQHICLSVEIDGKRLERYFSISSSIQQLETKKLFAISVKRQPNGLVTNWLDSNLTPGDVVHFKGMDGDFVMTHAEIPSIFVAAGSGITPMLSILESIEPEALKHHQLTYCVRGPEIPFRQRLKALQNQGLNLHIHDSKGHGRFRYDRMPLQLQIGPSQAFVCGPEQFITELSQAIAKSGLNEKAIFSERFHPISTSEDCTNVTLSWRGPDGSASDSISKGKSLLIEAENAGYKPIFGCRIGVCHQCTATKLRGRVKNHKTGEISDSGKQDIQLCICTAQGDVEIKLRERTA